MSAKYQQHPMERKAQAEMAAHRKEQAEVDAIYAIVVSQGAFADSPYARRAFRQGWTEGKFYRTNGAGAAVPAREALEDALALAKLVYIGMDSGAAWKEEARRRAVALSNRIEAHLGAGGDGSTGGEG